MQPCVVDPSGEVEMRLLEKLGMGGGVAVICIAAIAFGVMLWQWWDTLPKF